MDNASWDRKLLLDFAEYMLRKIFFLVNVEGRSIMDTVQGKIEESIEKSIKSVFMERMEERIMVTIEYRHLPSEEIDKIKPLWEKLNNHHHERAIVFKTDFEKMTFTERKRKLSIGKKEVRIIIALDGNTSQIVGYCISSIKKTWGKLIHYILMKNLEGLGLGRN